MNILKKFGPGQTVSYTLTEAPYQVVVARIQNKTKSRIIFEKPQPPVFRWAVKTKELNSIKTV